MTNSLFALSNKRLVDKVSTPNSLDTTKAMAELCRRQTNAQIMSARWMSISVIVLTIATILNVALLFGRFEIAVAGTTANNTVIARIDRFTGNVETCVTGLAWAGNAGATKTQPDWCAARMYISSDAEIAK